MKTYMDCIPCFLSQALAAARMAKASEKVQKKVLDKVAKAIPAFDINFCPSLMGRTLYNITRNITGVNDPYKDVKRKSNKLALGVYPALWAKVKRSKDKLLTAIELAIAGNIIDCGTRSTLNVTKEINKIMAKEAGIIKNENKDIFEYAKFEKALKNARTILYIGDNAGEIVFDKVLINAIKDYGVPKKIYFSVKDKPIINDALYEDAVMCGINKSAEILSSGCDAPGTLLDLCNRKFLKLFNSVDLVVSKGQGNFEALADDKKAAKRPVFFLLIAKCAVAARHTKCNVGDIILKAIK